MPDYDKNTCNWKDPITYAIAVLALLGFSWFIYYLVGRTPSANETEWTRAVYLLSGVEAIVFAAAGFLFGREVHRVRAEKAEERAVKAETGAIEAKGRAVAAETKGKSLSAAITAKLKTLESRTPEIKGLEAKTAVPSTQADLKELEVMAKSMFPSTGVEPGDEPPFDPGDEGNVTP